MSSPLFTLVMTAAIRVPFSGSHVIMVRPFFAAASNTAFGGIGSESFSLAEEPSTLLSLSKIMAKAERLVLMSVPPAEGMSWSAGAPLAIAAEISSVISICGSLAVCLYVCWVAT